MNENKTDNNTGRQKQPSSAAQKLLIIIMLAALAVLGGIFYHAAKHPHAAAIIDQLNRGVITTTATVPITTSETTASQTETTTSSATTSQSETTTSSDENTTVTTTAESGEYKTSFTVEFPESFGGQYSISVLFPNDEEPTEMANITVPDTTFTLIELSYNQASTYVPVEVYLTNAVNGKQALAGTINLDFANDLCDQSGLDIYTALLEVQ